jgi:SOS-response transcriptional repressor LexA
MATKTVEEATQRILRFFFREGRMPTDREIARLMGFKSHYSAQKLKLRLVQARKFSRDSKGRLGVPSPLNFPIPMVADIPAGRVTGFDTATEEETLETYTLSELLTVDLSKAKLFRVSGDSMIDAGIHEGDILLVETSARAKRGDIVIAEIDGEYMVKYYQVGKDGAPYLEAANPDIKPLHPKHSLNVYAVVKKCIKSFA